MTVVVQDLLNVLAFWDDQRTRYGYPLLGLVLCGKETNIDRTVWKYLTTNQKMLSEMSGAYCGLSIACELDGEVEGRDASTDPSSLSYLHKVTTSALGARSLYGLCHRLDIELDTMPTLVLVGDPTQAENRLAFSLLRIVEDVEERAIPDHLTRFFRILFTTCRRSSEIPPQRRLAFVRKSIEKEDLPGSGHWLAQVAESGVIAQVIQGIVKGLPG